MASAFNLTAQINLRGPTNLRPIIAQIKRELGTINADVKVNVDSRSAKSIDNITARLRVMNSVLTETRNHTQAVNQALGSLSSGFTALKSSSSGAATGMNQSLQTMKQTAKAVQVARTEMQEFGKQSYLAIKRFAAFSFVTTGIFALTNAITSGLKAFINFDKEMIRLQQVTGKGAIGLKSLEAEITRLATTLGVSSESLTNVATTLAQAGLNANDTRVALEALAKTELAPSFDDITQTTEGAIAALRQFELQTSDLEDALGSINSVAAAFAVESSDIITAIQRTGGVFAAASKGVSQGKDALNEFIAVFTSVRATTRESAETIATGLRTIFTRIQRARTIDQLKEFGVELTDLEGKFVGPYEAIKRLSSVLGELDPRDLRFSQIVEELGGFRQIGKVIPLIQQFATAQEALKIAQKGQGSLTEAAATAQKSLANQIAKVREQFLALVRDVGKSTVFQGLFKIVTNLASSLISLASAFKPILPILGILGAVKGASALTQFASGFFGSMNKGGGSKSVGENLGSSVTGAKEKERADATNRATEAIKANTAALNQLTSAVQSLTNKIGTSGTTTLNSGGQIRKFAGGGYVPGSGNRDTVPAMLTPGEFVIRKKAVETIGADKLHKMNKYANGGSVRSKKGSKGYSVLAPIIVDADDRNIEASHVGMNLGRLNPKEVETYTSMPARRGFRSKKFDPEQTMSAGITASETFKLGLPAIANQNMKTGKPGVTSGALRDWIRKNPELLFSGRGTIPQKALQVSPQIFAETFANALGAAHPAVLFDKDLSTAFESVRGLLSPKYLESRSGKVDLFSRPAGEERSQIRHEGFDIKKISDRFLNGGFIQKFMAGGVAEIATQQGKTVQEVLLEQIEALGKAGGVKKALGLPPGDRRLNSLLLPGNIKSGKNIEEAIAVIDKVLEERRASGQVEAEAIAQATKFGLVGIQPFDYSKQFGPEDIGGRSTYITARGLSSKYSDIIQEMQAEMSGASTKFAEKIQMRNIFGGSGPLAFDFDETLVSGADIFDASGNIDIVGYNDLERVAESLKNGKLTRLGEELKSRLSQFPDLLNNVRVLTARPQSNAPLLADKLKQLGLNIPENKIKGVTGPQNKINDIGELETLIDDRIKTIEALKVAGKKGIAYSPIISDLSGPAVAAGQASIEGAVLETALAKLGAPLRPDAEPGRPIDYPDGLGNAAQYFGIDRNLPTEVKRTIDGSSLYRTRKEIERAYTENQFAAGGVAEADPAKQKIIADLQAWEQKNNIKFDSDYFEDLVQKKLLEKQKTPKNFGQIALRTGDRIQATYFKNEERSGDVIADKIKNNLYSVQSSSATKGYGPKLYDVVMEAATEKGAMLTSDRKSVSDAAKGVWSYYFSNRGDVKKTPLDPTDWVSNNRLLDPKLYGPPDTWPPATDPAWILQSGYSKSPKDINDSSLVQRFAVGGEAQDIAKQMNKGTPIADSWWTGMFLGNNILFDWASPTKAFKIPTGEEIQVEQQFRKILREKAQREWMSFQDQNKKPREPLSKEELEKLRAMTAMSPETIANIEKQAEAKRVQKEVDRTSKINWDVEDAGLKRRTPEDYRRRFLGYANGGGVGQDTVPALLTPGEFVINKKAAQKIGYAQLHKMNKADKIQGFNKGGSVGGVQKFINGGSPSPVYGPTPPPSPLPSTGKAADELKFFAFKAKEAGESLGAFKKSLASRVVAESKNIQDNQTQQKEALKYSAIGQRSEFKGINLTLPDDLKKVQPILDSFAEKLQAIDPSISASDAQKAALDLAKGLISTNKSVDDIIKSNTNLKQVFDKTYDSATAGQLALEKVAKEAGFTADVLKNNLGNELKKQAFIQSEVGQKFGGLSERIPGLLESFSKTKVGKGTVKAADIFSGTNLTQGLEKRLGESGKFIGDKINALGGPMVALGGAVAIAADQITRNMTITDPNTAGAIGAVGGAGGGLASGALLGAQIAGPVGAMIAGVGGAIIGGIKGYFDAFNTKLLENNLKALDKSANELEIALKKLTIASNDATAAEVAKAAVGDQKTIKSTAQQAQLGFGPKSPARGWLEFFRQEPTGLISSVTGGGQEAEARQAIYANVERALGAFEKLGERNLARSSSNQVRDVLNQAAEAEKTGGAGAKQEVLARSNQTYQMMARQGFDPNEIFQAMGVQRMRQQGKDPTTATREELIAQGKELAAVEAEGALKQKLLAESIRETSIRAENLIDIFRRVTANLERFGNELNNIKNNTMDAANAMGGRAATGPVDRTNEQILSNVSAYSQEEINAVADQVSGLSGDQQLGNQVKAAKILQDELPKILKNTTGQDVEAVTDQLKDVFKAGNIEVPPDLFSSIEDSLREKLGGRTEVSMSDIAGETDVLEIAAKVQSEALKVASDYLKRFNDALDMATEFAKNYASAIDQADQMYMQAANVRLQADLKLAEALGNTTSLAEQNAPFENQVKGLSKGVIAGGSTDPNKIFGAMQEAIAERGRMQENVKQNAAALSKDPANLELQKQYTDSAKALETQNIKINNANKSLELLANDGTAAANALGKIQEQQRQVEGFGNFLEKVATADFDQLFQMRRESAALVVAENSGPEFMRNAENRQLAFAGLNAQKELYTPEEFRNKRADLLTKFYQSQGFKGEDKVPALGGMTLDEAMKRMRGGVSEDDPNVKAYREATARQAAAADQLGNAAMMVAQEFNNGLQKVMDQVATLPETMKEARASAEPEKKPEETTVPQDQKLVMDEAALQAIRDGLQFKGELPTLGLDPQLDTSMADLTKAIYVLIGAMATLGVAFAAYQAGGVGNLIGNVAGAVGGRRRRTGFGGDKAPRAGSKAAGDAAEKAGRKRKTDADIDAQRKRIDERSKPRKAKPEADTSKPKQLPPGGAIPSTPTPAPVKPVPTPESVPVKPSVASKAATAAVVAGAALEKVADAASVVDEVVGVATSATNIATGQGTVQDVVYGASDAAELAGRGGGLFNFLNKIPGVGTATKAIGGAVSSVGTKLGLGGLASSAGGALGSVGGTLGSVGSAIGVGKPILGATGGVGAGLGNFAALNTAISAVTNAVEFMSDPAAYSARKQAQSDAGLQRAQERTGYGEFAGDSLVGALEGFTDPVGKIVEGAYVMKDAAKDVSAAREAGAKTERITQAGQKQVAESRGGGAIGKLAFDEQRRAMEEAQIKTELQAAQRVQATGGSLGDVAKIFDTSEQGLGATNLQDFISKKESQLKTLPQDRIDSRETAKDGTFDWSSNTDPKGFAEAVSQELQYRLSQIQLPPLPVKPEVKPEDQTKLGISGTAVTTPEGKVAEQKTQTETSKAVDTMTSSTTTASKALEGLSAAAQSVVSALTGEKKPETVATDKKDTPAEVKSTVAAVAKTEAAVEPESCECKILKEILATLKSTSIDRQTTPTTSTPAQPVIPAPTPPGATPATTVQEPTTPISEAQAVSAAQTPKEVTNKEQDITQQAFVEGEDAITRAEKQYAPTAERKAFVMKELKDARQRQRIGQKLPTDDSVISASSFELKNITEAEKTKKREQYLLKKAPKFREKYMTKAEKESGLAEKLADQPQLKEEPKALNPYQQMLKGRRETYLSGKQSRRQAYLSRFRPEVRESMMTKEEKAARNKAQTQAAAQAAGGTENPVSTTPSNPNQGRDYSLNGPVLTPQQQEALNRAGAIASEHNANMAELERRQQAGETLTPQERNSLSVHKEGQRIAGQAATAQAARDPGTPLNPYANGDAQTSARMDSYSNPTRPFEQRLNANGPTATGGPTGSNGFQIQLDPNAQSFIDNLQNTFNSFNTYIDKLATVAATIPSKIELTGNYTLDVQISGAAAFDALEGRMKELAVSLVEPKLNALRDEVSAAMGGDKVKSSASMGNKMGPKK